MTKWRRDQKFMIGEKVVNFKTAIAYINQMKKQGEYIKLKDLAI